MNLSESTFEFEHFENKLDENVINFYYKVQTGDKSFRFCEKLILPELSIVNTNPVLIDNILHSLHLILGISYWKIFCSKLIRISTNTITLDQAEFWNAVYTKGLGEFFYKNNLDFRGLINFPHSLRKSGNPVSISINGKSLVGIGGGKDSAVVAELLQKNSSDFSTFIIQNTNQNKVAQNLSDITGKPRLNARRVIDPQLFELNKSKESYNGHIPISAIYAFISLLLAALYDFTFIIVGNERSANYGNADYLGQTINHQWSKSFEFEKLFQKYVSEFITPDIHYFSLLRPFSELKITEMFSRYPKYFPIFSSCNRVNKIKDQGNNNLLWCAECAKCAFVFLMLACFISHKDIITIFGENLLNKSSLISIYRQLLGIEGVKPFDCVGTPDEVKLAFRKLNQLNEFKDTLAVKMFVSEVLPTITDLKALDKEVYKLGENAVPDEFQKLITSTVL